MVALNTSGGPPVKVSVELTIHPTLPQAICSGPKTQFVSETASVTPNVVEATNRTHVHLTRFRLPLMIMIASVSPAATSAGFVAVSLHGVVAMAIATMSLAVAAPL